MSTPVPTSPATTPDSQPRHPLTVERWNHLELRLSVTPGGNPFDTVPTARFTHGHRTVSVEGFHDGDGQYLVRFMPDEVGLWSYVLDEHHEDETTRTGTFECLPAAPGNHGPVRVHSTRHFRYADGTAYRPFGTTCYAWTHQELSVQRRTLQTLRDSPFNKLRMCVFPKNYPFNDDEPVSYPFERVDAGGFDLTRPDPAFFRHLEQQVLALQDLGIECDLILFHPYDGGRWGFDRMRRDEDERYVRYVTARLAAFRNVWWSMANEYDFMTEKHLDDWDRLFSLVEQFDPYGHLRSIHNGTRMYEPSSLALYDHRRPWVTHVSLQHWDLQQMRLWDRSWDKPVVVDECGYEGDLPFRWGDLPAEQVVDSLWTGVVLGGYVSHGETYQRDDGVIWWARGGDLQGESPPRFAFLRALLDELPDEAAPLTTQRDVPTFGVEGEAYLQYFGHHRPAHRTFALPDDGDFVLDVVDTWAMTLHRLPGTHHGDTRVDLPSRTGLALLARRAPRGDRGPADT